MGIQLADSKPWGEEGLLQTLFALYVEQGYTSPMVFLSILLVCCIGIGTICKRQEEGRQARELLIAQKEAVQKFRYIHKMSLLELPEALGAEVMTFLDLKEVSQDTAEGL